MLFKITNTIYSAFVKLLENILSKKFLVFITSTFLLVKDILPPQYWTTITLAVLGVVSAIDFKHGSKSFDKTTTNIP